jgi:hypothetical protein
MIRFIGVAITVISLVPIAHANDAGAKFPGALECLKSPKGTFSICNEDHDEEPNHSLFLRDERSRRRTKLLDYDRNVEISWEPNSNLFFVNDNLGSDTADCYIMSIDGLKNIRILSEISKILPERVTNAHHLYVTCKIWRSEQSVEIGVEGYGGNIGGPNYSFDYRYDLNIQSLHFKKMK